MTTGDAGREAQRKARLAAQRASRMQRLMTPKQVADRKRYEYARKLRKSLGFAPKLALDTFRGFRDCLSGEPL